MVENSQFAFDLDVAMEAARRWRQQTQVMKSKQRALERGDYEEVDTKARLAKRANRLMKALRQGLPEDVVETNDVLLEMAGRADFTEVDIDNLAFERVIGPTADFLSINFFNYGQRASKSVCRLVTRVEGGREAYGTGFMVTPRLLLTNHHVLKAEESATRTRAQFRYEIGDGGDRLVPDEFDLDPATFFLNDKDLDFALVAVVRTSRSGGDLARYGYCPLIAAEGKIIPGECMPLRFGPVTMSCH